MGFVKMTCPNCGANFDMNGDLDFGVCNFCGTKIAVEKTIVEHRGSVSVKGVADVDAILDRASLFLEDGNYEDALRYCEKALDISPRNFQAYLLHLLAETKSKTIEDLKNSNSELDSFDAYHKAVRFANDDNKKILITLKHINNLIRLSKCKSFSDLANCKIPIDRFDSYHLALTTALDGIKEKLITYNEQSNKSYQDRITKQLSEYEENYNIIMDNKQKEIKKGWNKFCLFYILGLILVVFALGFLVTILKMELLYFVLGILLIIGVVFFVTKSLDSKKLVKIYDAQLGSLRDQINKCKKELKSIVIQ